MKRMIPDNIVKCGVMGGAFDPIHLGHLKLADQALSSFDLSAVLFVVSFNPPHRQKPIASFENRLEMTSLAIEENDRFYISDLEKEIDGPRYTVNMIESLKRQYPKIEWFLILGEDNIGIFEKWYKPEELIKQTNIIIGNRPGFENELEKSKWSDKIKRFEMPLIYISSTDIRNNIKAKKSFDDMVPPKTHRYIIDKGLYL